MKSLKPLLFLVLCLALTACAPKEKAPELDLDYIAGALTSSGYFPEPLDAQDPELVPGLLNLYEDRISASPEDIAQARFTMSLGMVADQFILLEAKDHAASERLEAALDTYAQDQKSAYEFYAPGQAARMDDPILEHAGSYLLFAVGADRDGLSELCQHLMSGEEVDLAAFQPDISAPSEPEPSGPAASEEPPAPLTDADKAAAYDAAMDYYLGTAFEVQTLTEISLPAGWEGEVAFRVTCSKGGMKQDPDRTISLERKDGAWTVVSEGY